MRAYNKIAAVALFLSLGLFPGCDFTPSPKSTISDPDSVKTEQVSPNDTSKSNFKYLDGIRVPEEPVQVPVAKLVNENLYSIDIGGDGDKNFLYRIITFNYKNAKHRFLSDKIMDYSIGSTFKFSYWDLPENIKLTDRKYFKTFVDVDDVMWMPEDKYIRPISENIEGVIKDIERIEE